MAIIKNRELFFTTSPRTPSKMIPEIKLLVENFSDQPWNQKTQAKFIDLLAESNDFHGQGSSIDKSFSARDRINRAPKALGFVDLKPLIKLTDAGSEFIYGKRPQEIFLRQLLKFQLPSPYHQESNTIKGSFLIHPYLEIFRLVRDLEYLTFDEFKIFALQLTNYKDYSKIYDAIINFRYHLPEHKGQYKQYINTLFNDSINNIYKLDILSGNTKTRESNDRSLTKFIHTKESNRRDYTDACFRYLQYTGLICIHQYNRSISIYPEKIDEVNYILDNVSRTPIFINDDIGYKNYLFDAHHPILLTDNKNDIIEILSQTYFLKRSELESKSLTELKDLRDDLTYINKVHVIEEQISEIKLNDIYPDIITMYNNINDKVYYDCPLMLEYNTWRAMTMIDDGCIKGNFKFDDEGQPLSTAPGNVPDIICDYNDFILTVEVTLQNGNRQFDSEGESIARHRGKIQIQTGKDTYCLFIAKNIVDTVYTYLYTLNKTNLLTYGGKSKIIPLTIKQFELFITIYHQNECFTSNDIKIFLDDLLILADKADNDIDWKDNIQKYLNELVA